MTSAAESIARALGGKPSGGGWRCCCPAHDDRSPSLSINEGADGRVLVNCRAGCPQDAVIDALQRKGLWNGKGKGNGHDRLTYHIYSKDGEPYARKVRNVPGRDPKCWWEQADGKGGWCSAKKGLKGISKADRQRLYKIDEATEAAAQGRAIAVAEGEKDCDTLWTLGVPAVCSPDGASKDTQKPKWRAEYSEQLRDANIVVLNDNDEAGYAHADATCRLSVGVAKSVRRLDLKNHWPDIGEGEDVSDWLAKGGGTRERLDELMLNAPPYAAPAVAATTEGGATRWRGCHRDGAPIANMHNAQAAITRIGVRCSYDTFHNKLLVGYSGDPPHEVQQLLGEVTDAAVLALRRVLANEFCTDFGTTHVRDAVTDLAHQRRFDPVCDMLAEAQGAWDRVERLDRAAVDYLNAADTPLNRAIIRKTMIAAVRRARQPGCKFDNIVVLESPEGWNKSKAWRVLAGDENFSDESILGKGGREVQEQLARCWIHESADLAGMRKAEVETVKAFASRQVDIARPAYGYFVKEQPRHAINVATTNSDEYLQSQTGNRRFWPVRVLRAIDTEKLARDRLLLWGEAAYLESQGESLTLAEDLWALAGEQQEQRRVKDPWEDKLADIPNTALVWNARIMMHDSVQIIYEIDDGERYFVASEDLLTHVLKVPIERQDRSHAMRLAETMKRLEWQRERVMRDGVQRRGFTRQRLRCQPRANLF
jgi:hypothetical protein